jgi:hypothetical protein
LGSTTINAYAGEPPLTLEDASEAFAVALPGLSIIAIRPNLEVAA